MDMLHQAHSHRNLRRHDGSHCMDNITDTNPLNITGLWMIIGHVIFRQEWLSQNTAFVHTRQSCSSVDRSVRTA